MSRTTFILTVILLTCPAFADDETIVFVGLPTTFSIVLSEGSKQVAIEGEESTDKKLVIVKRDGKYYWRSREDKELFYVQSGAFHFFIAPASGYIKILESRFVQPLSDEELPPFMYFEQMSQWLDTYTYHGVGRSLDL